MLNRICGLLADDPPVIPTPTVGSVSPNGAPVCGGDAVYVVGTGFYGPIDAIGVTINGVACTDVERVTPRLLRVIVPIGAAHGNAYDLVVTTAAGADTLSAGFTYTPSAFTLTGIAPDGGREDGDITLTGTGFLDVDDVLGNGFSLAVWAIVDDRHITATVEPQGPPTPYTASIEVYQAAGPTTLSISYACFDGAPAVTSLTPSSGFAINDTPITSLAGQNFIDGATVTFDGVPANDVVFVSSTELTCTAPAHADGAVDVVVTNPDMQDSGATGAAAFTYNAAPTVSSITPSFGYMSGGTTITDIAGTFFRAGATVTIGGMSAAGVTVNSANSISCSAPGGSFGVADVVVTNTDTQDSGASGDGLFTFFARIPFDNFSSGLISQSSFLSVSGLSSFTRAATSPNANCDTVQNSATTVLITTAANQARIYDDGTHTGFLIEQAVKQGLTGTNSPRDISGGWSVSAQGTQTSNYGSQAGPDGQLKASRVGLSSTSNISNYGDLGSDTAVRWCFSQWARSKLASSNGDMEIVMGNVANTAHVSATRAASNVWAKYETAKGATPMRYIYPVNSWDWHTTGAEAAKLRDTLIDFMQLERGDFSTSCISKGANTRGRDLAKWTMPTANSRINFYARFRPLFASSMQVWYDASGTATVQTGWIIYSSDTGTNYLYVNDSDKKIKVRVGGGSVLTSTNAVSWAAFDDVELLVEVGNNVASTLKYQVNGGGWTDLVLATDAGNPTPGTDVALMTSDGSAAFTLPCLLREVRSYPVEITESDL